MARKWPSKLRDAKALLKLRDQIDALAPNRDKSSDGIRANKQHSKVNPDSDHEPHVLDGDVGVFTAIDISHDPSDGVDAHALAEHLREIGNHGEEPRLKYVISRSRIWNPSVSSTWRPYKGKKKNPHDMHTHISVMPNKALYDSEREWNIGNISVPVTDTNFVKPPPTLRRGSKGIHVVQLQRLLAIKDDGDFGAGTERAVRGFQKTFGLKVDGVVGPYTWRVLHEHPILKQDETFSSSIEGPWQTNIIASVFGGRVDKFKERSAYDGRVLNNTGLYVSLPYRFHGVRRKVKVTNRATNKSVICTIEDVGPWLIDDPYWVSRTRPLAEISYQTRVPLSRGPNKGRVANGAGIDLSPAAARAIEISGTGRVDFCFVD